MYDAKQIRLPHLAPYQYSATVISRGVNDIVQFFHDYFKEAFVSAESDNLIHGSLSIQSSKCGLLASILT